MAEQAKTGDRKDNAKQAIVQLLALGQKKGELTYEEIGDALGKMDLTPDEMELLVSGNDLDKRKCLSRIFTECRAVVNGDSYIPDSIMEKYNETYGTHYDCGDVDLDTEELSGKTVCLGKFPLRNRGEAR